MTKQEDIMESGEELQVGDLVVRGEDGKYYKIQSRQEEIKEVTAQSIRLGICAYQHLGFDNLEMYNKIADEVLKIQFRKGVVIKVEKEPSETKREDGEQKYYGDVPGEMYEDGWRLVESLIKEVSNG